MALPRVWAWRTLPLAVAGALGLYQLAQPSIWIDEAFTWRAMSRDVPWLLTQELHAAYYLAMKAWTSVAGTSEFALRLPSVFGLVLAVALLYGLARALFGERVAFISAMLFAVNPFAVLWAQQARSYTFLVCLAIGATWALVRARGANRGAVWALYGALVFTMIIVQFFSAFLLLVCHAVVAWRSPRARITVAYALVGALPWLAVTLDRGETGTPVNWLSAPGTDAGGTIVALSGAYGVGLVLAIIGLRNEHRVLLATWAFLPFMVSLIGSVWKPMFLDRYLIISVPAFAILGAIGVLSLSGWLRRVAVTAFGIGACVGLAFYYAPSGGDNWRGENWRRASEEVGYRAQVVPNSLWQPFAYYGGEIESGGNVIIWFAPRNELGGLRVVRARPPLRSTGD